jgi:hypothetical protein
MITLIRTRFLPVYISLSMLLLYSCRHAKETTEEATIVKTPVTIAQVEYKSVASTVTLPAVATFMNKSVVRATTSGIIDKVLIDPGQSISADQLLFTIRTREALALDKSGRSDSSLNFKGLINILSHKEGVINSTAYQKGDFVQEGDEMAIVSDQSSLVFILDVPIELDRYIEKNRRCRITLPDHRHIDAAIIRKLAEMDMQSQTVRYVVKPASEERFPANLIASIDLVKSTNEKALVMPKQAVLGNETQTEFWVMKLLNDSTAIRVDITKGYENNEEIEITTPEFLPSDRVVLTGNYGLPDTARITISKK